MRLIHQMWLQLNKGLSNCKRHNIKKWCRNKKIICMVHQLLFLFPDSCFFFFLFLCMFVCVIAPHTCSSSCIPTLLLQTSPFSLPDCSFFSSGTSQADIIGGDKHFFRTSINIPSSHPESSRSFCLSHREVWSFVSALLLAC